MPTVLKQLSLIIAALATVVTLLAGRAAGVRATQLGLRSAAAFAVFFVGADLLARGVVSLTSDAWPGGKPRAWDAPPKPPMVGQRLDVTLGASPGEAAFTPLSITELVAAGRGGKEAEEAAQRLAADPTAMARVVAALSQGDQEG